MKIIKETFDQLILDAKSGGNLFLLIFGLLFGGIPLFSLVGFIYDLGVTNINCQKKLDVIQVNCYINRSGFFGLIERDNKFLNQVTDVKFEQTESEDSDGNTTINNKVIIVNESEDNFIIDDFIVNAGAKNVAKMRAIESKISHFLHSDQFSFLLNLDNRWRWSNLFGLGLISIFIIVGGGIVFLGISIDFYTKIVFDKLTQQFHLEKVNLLGKKKETHKLREITSIIIEQSTDSDDVKNYSLILLIEGNKKYTISNYNSQEIANKIANFLQLKIEYIIK